MIASIHSKLPGTESQFCLRGAASEKVGFSDWALWLIVREERRRRARLSASDTSPMDSERIKRLLERDRFAHENGMRIVEIRRGFARTEMTVEARHLNAVGILQGGALFTLADLAFAGASNSHGVVAVSVQADVTWFRAVDSGKLTAVAEEVSRSSKLSTCVVRVSNERDELVALFKGVAYIKGSPLEA